MSYKTTAEIREIIKAKTGYNARQVSVKAPHSTTYVKVTIRDAAVDIAKVKEAVKALDTWHMDESDYCTGQSISVDTTPEVDAVHAAPFVPEVEAAVKRILETGKEGCTNMREGVWMRIDDRDTVIFDSNKDTRTTCCYSPEVITFNKRTIEALALRYSRL